MSLKVIGFWLGAALFASVLLLVQPSETLSSTAIKVAAVTCLMACWWLTEALPLPATALLPTVLFPFLDIASAKTVSQSYGHPLIFLFIGGFFMASAVEKSQLHRRIALGVIRYLGSKPPRLILGFMVSTAILSMWISNTATTMLMLPIALAVIGKMNTQSDTFAKALLLSIAYGATIGGTATLIGTPPNAVLAAVIEDLYGYTIGFAQWMTFGIPLSFIMLMLTWFLLTRVLHQVPADNQISVDATLNAERKKLGSMSFAEKAVAIVFTVVAISWTVRGLIQTDNWKFVHDSTIAIAGALLMFSIPLPQSEHNKNKYLLNWETAVAIPWGILLLFGGGLSLASGIKSSGLAQAIADGLYTFHHWPFVLFMLLLAIGTTFLTEVTSNTATSAILLPIVGAGAVAMGIHPFGPLFAVAIASSYAYMLPVATPPNAIVFGSGQIQIRDMAQSGFVLNILGCIILVSVIYLWLPVIWSIDLSQIPHWVSSP